MLKALRKKEVAKKILYVLAAIIIPAFVLWGSGSFIRNKLSTNFAGKIFGNKITIEQFQDSLLACKNQGIIRFGDNFYKIQQFLNLEKEAWDRIILLYEARKRKIKVADNEVIERIKFFPLFQSNGKFQSKIYQYFLDYIFKTSARIFEEQTRESLMFEKLYEQVSSNITIPKEQILDSYKKENEKIKVGYIGFLAKDFLDKVSLQENELTDYFQAHSADFTKPPSVNVQYIGADYPKESNEEEKKNIEEKIAEVYSNIKSETDFEKISQKYSLEIKETGFFSLEAPIPSLGFQLEFMQVAFDLKDKEISKPIKTTKGIYILKLKEKKDSYTPNFEEVKTSVETLLKQKKAKELAHNKAKEYLAKLKEISSANPANFDFKKTVESESLTYKQSPLFNYGQYVPDIGVSKEFSDEAFSLTDKTKIFGLVQTEMGSFIIRLEEFVPIDENKFAQEKEEFKKKLLQLKKDAEFDKFFLELKRKANLLNNIPALQEGRSKNSPNIPQIDEF